VSRRRKLVLVVVAGLVLLGAGLRWALPEIVRRVALDQIPKRTGRGVAIGAIDLNPFTGRLVVTGFRLADREEPEPLVAFERLSIQLSLVALLRSRIELGEIVLTAPSVRIVRTERTEFNFSDLLPGGTEPEPAAPSRWTIAVQRLNISRGRLRATDRAVTPPVEWVLDGLGVDGASLTTARGAPAGRIALHTTINEAVLDVRVDPLRPEPRLTTVRMTLEGFETRRLTPYVYEPLGTRYRPRGGRLALALTAHEQVDAAGRLERAVLSGTAKLEGESLVVGGRDRPFLAASRIELDIKEANALSRSLTIGRVAIEGLDLEARRDAKGVIDLLALFAPARTHATPAGRDGAAGVDTPAAGSSPSPPPPSERRVLFPILQALARGFERIHVEQITLAPSMARFVDEAVSPAATLPLTQIRARIDDFTWPVRGPATVALSTGLPGGGTLDIKGPVTVQPFDAALTIALRDAPVEPYQPYIPVPARLSGRFSGDSVNRIAIRDGRFIAQSKGRSWGRDVAIREPGAARPAIRVDRMELAGIDFDWPRRGTVARAGFQRPRLEVERSADGSIDLRRLFATPEVKPAAPPSDPVPSAAGASRPAESDDLVDTMRLEFGEVRVDDGAVRFLDRTTRPAFSQDLSRLALTVTGLGNRPGRRATLALQSVVGGAASVDVRGEIGPVGSPLSLDLLGELRRFPLPSLDPYASEAIGWVAKRGELQYKGRVKLDGDELSADNEVAIGQLQVAQASGGDEVKRRVGLPLGLIVALIKDQQGEIRASIPVTGKVSDPHFAIGDAIWAAAGNVLVNLATSPFKAIGRLFTSSETAAEPTVDPVTFAAGSAALSPAMEDHLLRVADFLRQSPFVSLALASVPGEADVEGLKGEIVAARLRELQPGGGAAADLTDALARYYEAHLPDVALPATVEEQLALLRQREPRPDAALADLARRRLEAARERLVTVEGIPESRVTVREAPPPDVTGDGRVEFAIVARE
jgi:uncharacterized protein DUF748